MEKEKLMEIIKKRFGTSDEDLADLEIVMDAFDGIERADTLEKEIANVKLENEKALKDLDDTWRKRYRDRFFNGDSGVEEIIDKLEEDEKEETGEDISIEDFLEEITKEDEEKR